jgi:hypothetical protein
MITVATCSRGSGKRLIVVYKRLFMNLEALSDLAVRP